MKHLAAYCLLVLSGKQNPSNPLYHFILFKFPNHIIIKLDLIFNLTINIAADEINKLLKDVGAVADKEAITNLLNAMKGKKLHELVQAGSHKLAVAPSTYNQTFFSLSDFINTNYVLGGPSQAAVEAPVESKKGGDKAKPKEKEVEKEVVVEADVNMGGLFGEDEDF